MNTQKLNLLRAYDEYEEYLRAHIPNLLKYVSVTNFVITIRAKILPYFPHIFLENFIHFLSP